LANRHPSPGEIDQDDEGDTQVYRDADDPYRAHDVVPCDAHGGEAPERDAALDGHSGADFVNNQDINN
jgi:hypothetical protein